MSKKETQPLPAGFIDAVVEAAAILGAVDPDHAPKNMRWPLADELDGFVGIINATPPAQQEPVAFEPNDAELFKAFTRSNNGPNPFYRCNTCGDTEPGVREYLSAHWLKHNKTSPQPAQQEPVAWMHEWEDGERIPLMYPQDDRNDDKPKSVRPLLYGDTTPQPAQRTWVGLTDEERYECLYASDCRDALCAAIEAKLKEKNT